MAKMFATGGAMLDTVQETAQYISERVSVLRYNSIYENYVEWYSEKRPETSVPPQLRDGYISFVKAKRNQEK